MGRFPYARCRCFFSIRKLAMGLFLFQHGPIPIPIWAYSYGNRVLFQHVKLHCKNFQDIFVSLLTNYMDYFPGVKLTRVLNNYKEIF